MPVVPATQEAIRHAAEALAGGEIVAFPTETVYGLGANALDARAVAKVFAAKERPRFNPLIVHVPGLGEAEKYAVVTDTARMLAQAFWPGPLSLVLKKRPASGIVDLVSAGLETIALRAPAHPVAQALLNGCNFDVAFAFARSCDSLSTSALDQILEILDAKLALSPKATPRRPRANFHDDSDSALVHAACSGLIARLRRPLPKRLPSFADIKTTPSEFSPGGVV